jgi:hypothetical protein
MYKIQFARLSSIIGTYIPPSSGRQFNIASEKETSVLFENRELINLKKTSKKIGHEKYKM